jgi:hypothetical protein
VEDEVEARDDRHDDEDEDDDDDRVVEQLGAGRPHHLAQLVDDLADEEPEGLEQPADRVALTGTPLGGASRPAVARTCFGHALLLSLC